MGAGYSHPPPAAKMQPPVPLRANFAAALPPHGANPCGYTTGLPCPQRPLPPPPARMSAGSGAGGKETMVASWTDLLPPAAQSQISHGAGALRDSEISNWRKDYASP